MDSSSVAAGDSGSISTVSSRATGLLQEQCEHIGASQDMCVCVCVCVWQPQIEYSHKRGARLGLHVAVTERTNGALQRGPVAGAGIVGCVRKDRANEAAIKLCAWSERDSELEIRE